MQPVCRCSNESCHSPHEEYIHHVSERGRFGVKGPPGIGEEGKSYRSTEGNEVGDRLALAVLYANGKHNPVDKRVKNSNRHVSGK